MFPGLIPILNSYLENMEVDVDTRCSILNYLKLIKKRASGIASFAFSSSKKKKKIKKLSHNAGRTSQSYSTVS